MRLRSCCVSEPGSQRVETAEAAESIRALVDNLARVLHAPDETLQLCVLCLVGEGHLILEDFPGVGKTMLAKALARSLDVSFSRMQFTPDLLPSDVTGVNVFNQRSNEFEFKPGPVFANLLLVDEINRASPKTQAALLECMQEQQVTIDGVTYPLARPFMVMATQNPIEYEGTYPLPEAQLDRFTMRIAIGYPPLSEEAAMLAEQTADPPLDGLEPVADATDALALAEEAKAIFVEESLNRYVVALLRATRGDSRLYLGASPRAGIALLRVAKARALAEGRGFMEPDDVKAVAVPVLSHRLILAPEARATGLTGEQIVRETLEKTPVPV
ncbi:MAG: MoxR family ATPase [Actinobacteria bacterium]|nr:MAG: MoxR family ATPase [Actinomycetota bacterium]